ncbi:hypothetical protein ACM66B_005486 [Microbotryomycetes sp. NB124-2]
MEAAIGAHAIFEQLHFGSHPGSPIHEDDDVEHSPSNSSSSGATADTSSSPASSADHQHHFGHAQFGDHWPRVAGVDADEDESSLGANAFISTAAATHQHHHQHHQLADSMHSLDDMRLTGDFWSTAPSTTAPSPAATATYANSNDKHQTERQQHVGMDLDTNTGGPSSMGSPEPTFSFAQHFAPITDAAMPPMSFEMSQPVDLHAVNAGISPHLTSSRQPTPPHHFDEQQQQQYQDSLTAAAPSEHIDQDTVHEQRPAMPERRSTRDRSRVTSRNQSRDTSLSRSNSTTALSSATTRASGPKGTKSSKTTSTPHLSSADLLQATIIGASTNLVTKDAVIVSKTLTKCSQPDRTTVVKPGSGLELMVLGVPRFGAKSRVETQIKITLALVKPRSSPKKGAHEQQQHLVDGGYEQFLTFDGSLDPQVNDYYERVGSWSHLRLPGIQALKKRVKKQSKPDPTPEETLLLDVAVVRASEDEEQIFICDGCQQRERKRAQRKKDTSAAKAQDDQNNCSSAGQQKESLPTLTPEQERRKVVVFNCSEFVELTGGEIVLPTRITCYCRHHKEKKGFMVQFTVRNYLGQVVASGTTPPIMITDDHKTKDARPLQIVQQDDDTQIVAPVVAASKTKKAKSSKAKKAKAAASSSSSSAAAATQRSKRSVSGRSPAEEGELDEQSTSISPVSGTSTPASSSRVSAATASKKPKPYDADARPRKQRASGAHRSPGFAMTPLVGMSPATRTVDLASLPGSHAPSPSAAAATAAAEMNAQYLQAQHASAQYADQSTALGLGGMTDTVMTDMASQMMARQSISTEHSTVTSPGPGGFDWRSNGSSPPLSPRSSVGTSISTANEFQSMLDAFNSPAVPVTNLPNMIGPMSVNMGGAPSMSSAAAAQAAVLSTLDWSSGAGLQHLQHHQLQQQPIQRPQPRISRLIPGEGPTHGGIEVTVLGEHFVPDLVCMFGDSPAVPTHYWSSTTLVCVLPPSANPGPVVVGIKGVRLSIDTGTEGLQLFTYRDDSDRGLLELALQVVGLKMTGKLEDASAVAMRIVGNNGQGSSNGSAQSTRSSQSPGAPIMTYRDTASLMQHLHMAASSVQTTPTTSRPSSRTHSRRSSLSSLSGASSDVAPPPLPYTSADGETRNFESVVIKFLSLLDLDASQIPGAAPSLPSSSPPISHANAQRHNLLHLATVLGFHRLAQFLIARGIEVDAADRNGFTPLHFAALYGRVAITRLLLEAGADLDRRNLAGRSAEAIARMRDDVDVEDVLIRARQRRQALMPISIATPLSRPFTSLTGQRSAYDSRRRLSHASHRFSPVSVSTELDSDTVSNEFDDSDRYDSQDDVDSDEVPDSHEDDDGSSSSSSSEWDAESEEELVSSGGEDDVRVGALSLSESEEVDESLSEEASESDSSEEDDDSEKEEDSDSEGEHDNVALEESAADRRLSRNASMVSLHYLLTAEEAEQQEQKRTSTQTPAWATGDSKDRADTAKRDLLAGWPFARPQLKKRHSSQSKASVNNVPDVKQLATGGVTMNAWEKAARFAIPIPIQMPELATFQVMASNVVPAALTKSWRGISTSSSSTKETAELVAVGEGEGHSNSTGTDSDTTVRPSLLRNRTDSVGTSSTDDGSDRSPTTRAWRNLYGAGPWLRNHALPPSSPPPMYSPTDHLSGVSIADEKTMPPWSESSTFDAPVQTDEHQQQKPSARSGQQQHRAGTSLTSAQQSFGTAKPRRSHRSSDDRAIKVAHGLHNDRMLWLFWIPVLLVALSTATYANWDLMRSALESVTQHPALAKLIK